MGEVIGEPVVQPLIGRSTIKINQATMYQALEYYFEKYVFQVPVKVESVNQVKDGQCPMFTIDLQPAKGE